ncbi:MAG TPA: pyridoxal phosphate-dependent aminotransferase [Polyangiales bacterium]|nr:pyridoxal phosphate-dependent aminotransferase [Polyangiales bacterium]
MPHFPHCAKSADGLSEGVFGKLVQRPGAGRVYSLHVGDTYLDPLPFARAEAQRSEAHPRLHNYAPPQGEPELLRAIVSKVQRRSGVTLDPGCVQVMLGATGAMGVICNTLVEAGDEVIIPSPFWPLIRGAVRARGGTAVELPLFTRLDEPGFDPVAAIERAITPRTTALYLNTPHNPTGRVLSEQALRGIAELAERHKLWIISDDVYEDVWFGATAPQSSFARADMAERTIATHSVSKAYGLAGARVGYTHGPREIMDVIRGVQTFYSYCAPRPMQYGAAAALDQGDAWLEDMRALYGRAGRAAAHALEIPEPQGGTFLFFDLAPYMRAGEDLNAILARCLDGGVMLTPGPACGSDFATWARLCFTTVRESELHEALALLRAVLFG